MEDKERQAEVPFFVHEGVIERMDRVNKRMLVSLLAVCITLALTASAAIFGLVYTNRMWMQHVDSLREQGTYGVFQPSDPATD